VIHDKGSARRLLMQIDFTPDKVLFPFQSRWFAEAGPRVHYIDEGAGRPRALAALASIHSSNKRDPSGGF